MSIKCRCDKCGRELTVPRLHTLPVGWERIMGDDYCNECMEVVKDALNKVQRREL